MATVKNRPSAYLTRAKLASPKATESSKAASDRSEDRPRRPIGYIDTAGYLHWNVPAKRTR